MTKLTPSQRDILRKGTPRQIQGLFERLAEELQTKQTNPTDKPDLMVTYGGIHGYPPGTYNGNGRIVLIKKYGYNQTQTPKQVIQGIYAETSPDKIDRIYLYIGYSGLEQQLKTAQIIAEQSSNLILVSCFCNKQEKKDFAKTTSVPIAWFHCHNQCGYDYLGKFVKRRWGVSEYSSIEVQKRRLGELAQMMGNRAERLEQQAKSQTQKNLKSNTNGEIK